MNTVRLSSGMSDTDKIRGQCSATAFELNGKKFYLDILVCFQNFGSLTCANAE